MNLTVLYRGHLSSCNYACGYCPFAKRRENAAQQHRDEESLNLFIDWLCQQSAHRWRVFFTPWGEALVRRWYREAVMRLSHLPHVDSIAVQTNLSGGLGWVRRCRADRLAFWATYHPTETGLGPFVAQVARLRAAGIRISVGMVGVPESLPQATALRVRLPADVYLWINAQQPRRRPYLPAEVAAFQSIDPQFSLTARRQPSLGRACRAGERTMTVDGAGQIRRCHFVDEVIGHIADLAWAESLRPRPCPNRFCDCFLGKAQLQGEAWQEHFAGAVLERQPRDFLYSLPGTTSDGIIAPAAE